MKHLDRITNLLVEAERISSALNASAAQDQSRLEELDAKILACDQLIAESRAAQASDVQQRQNQLSRLEQEASEIGREFRRLKDEEGNLHE
jgi:hypothetical protein